MNKRGLEFKSMIFSVIVFSAVMIAAGAIITSWGVKYNSGVTSDLESLSKLESTAGTVQGQQDTLNPNTQDPGVDAEANTFKGAFGIIGRTFAIFTDVYGEEGIIEGLSNRIGLPDYVKLMIISLITAAIAFTIVAIVFRLGRSSA